MADSESIPAVGLTVSVALCTLLTALNAKAGADSAQQSVLSSSFCIIACSLYIAFMLISRILYVVLNQMEYRSHYYDEIRLHSSGGGIGGEGESLLMSMVVDGSAGDGIVEDSIDSRSGLISDAPHNNRNRHIALAMTTAHREAFVSSMYMGGIGAFLSLPALCMWDVSVTACFLVSLGMIGCTMENVKVVDFKPNTDAGKAVIWLQRIRFNMYLLFAVTSAGVLWLDVHGTRFHSTYIYYANITSAAASNNATTAYAASSAASGVTVMAAGGGEGLLQWPLMLLAASSPLLLRIGTLQRRISMLMTPSQSLEAGLPVSTLAAVLVLCWYAPVETVLSADELKKPQAIAMFILCPPFLAAIIGIIIRGFRKGHSGLTANILLCTCVVRQQVCDRKLQTYSDWGVLSGAVNVVVLSGIWVWYRSIVIDFKLHKRHLHNNNKSSDSSLLFGATQKQQQQQSSSSTLSTTTVIATIEEDDDFDSIINKNDAADEEEEAQV